MERGDIASHLRPLMEAVAYAGCDFALVPQGAAAIAFPARRGPLILVVGDDMAESRGPAAFDPIWLGALIRDCQFGLFAAGAPVDAAYAEAAAHAADARRNVVIFETTPLHLDAWLAFAGRAQPELRYSIASPAWGHA